MDEAKWELEEKLDWCGGGLHDIVAQGNTKKDHGKSCLFEQSSSLQERRNITVNLHCFIKKI